MSRTPDGQSYTCTPACSCIPLRQEAGLTLLESTACAQDSAVSLPHAGSNNNSSVIENGCAEKLTELQPVVGA